MPTYYKRNTNPTNNNWNQADNWSTVSSTSAVNTGTFPQSSTLDPVIFDANSTQVTVNVASVCTSLNFTGYTNTITLTNGITVGGNVTLGAGMTTTGTGTLTVSATATLTSNGKTWSGSLSMTAATTYTFADNWRLGGSITFAGNQGGYQGSTAGIIIYVGGTILSTGAAGNFSVTNVLTLVLEGSGTISMSGTQGIRGINITFNTAGTYTIGDFFWGGGTMTYIAGTITCTGVLENRYTSWGGSITSTMNTAGIVWNNINTQGNYTLLSNITLTGNLVNLTQNSTWNGFTWNIGGNLSATGAGTIVSAGTSKLRLTGNTPTISTTSATHTWSLDIESAVGTSLTIGSNFTYRTTTFTHTSGTISGTINFGGTWTVNGNSLSLPAITVNAATTFNVNGTGYSIPGTFTANASVTFAGANNLTIGTFTGTTGGLTHTFVSTRTYTITTLAIAGTTASPTLIRSSVGGSKAIITLTNASYNYRLNVTDIDGSLGAAGNTFGTVTTSFNWTGSTFLYYVGAANWSSTSSWSSTSGGVAISVISVPGSSDDVLFDVNSVNSCTLNVAAVCKTINFTGYAQTLTLTNGITVSGNVTLAAGMTITGTGTLAINATATATSNGKQWSGAFSWFGVVGTLTLGDNWDVVGTVSVGFNGNPASTNFLGSKSITCRSSVLFGALSNSSNNTIILAGSGSHTLSHLPSAISQATSLFTGSITINCTGTYTLTSDIGCGAGTITYSAGTIVTSGYTLWLGNVTLNTSGMTWGNVSASVNPTITLTTDFNMSGTFSSGFSSSLTINGVGRLFNIGSSLVFGGTGTSFLSGTATIVMNGTGSISSPSIATTHGIRINMNITGPSVTLSGAVNYGGSATLTLSNNLGGSGTLTLFGSCTIVGGGYSIPNLSFINNAGTILTVSTSDFTVTGNTTFSTITNTATINGVGRTINIGGNLTMSALTTGIVTGTANLKMTGTGNLSMNASVTTGYLANNLEIASSNVTIVNTIRYRTGTFKLSGSLLGTGVLSILSSINLDGGGFTIPNLYASASNITITLLSNIVISGAFQSMLGTSGARVLFTSNLGGTRRKLTLNYTGTQAIMYTNATDIDSGDGQTIWSFGSPTLNNTINWGEIKAPVTKGFIRG